MVIFEVAGRDLPFKIKCRYIYVRSCVCTLLIYLIRKVEVTVSETMSSTNRESVIGIFGELKNSKSRRSLEIEHFCRYSRDGDFNSTKKRFMSPMIEIKMCSSVCICLWWWWCLRCVKVCVSVSVQ